MLDAASVLSDRVSAAIEAAFGLEGVDPVLRPSQFADVQANAALALAKKVGTNPREAAARIVANLDLSDVGVVEVSGPGFLNITVSPEWIDPRARSAAPGALAVRPPHPAGTPS